MKLIASKNNKTINKFEKFVLTTSKKKNVKGGVEPIIIEEIVMG